MKENWVKIKVTGFSKFNLLSDGKEYKLTQKSGLKKEDFVLGQEYEVDLFNYNGTLYIKSKKSDTTEVAPIVDKEIVPPSQLVEVSVLPQGFKVVDGAPTKNGKVLSPYELDTDVRIHWSGIVQALEQSTSLVRHDESLEEWAENVERYAERFVAFIAKKVEERKKMKGGE